MTLKTTPLFEAHEALGASFTDFNGWNMPLKYSSEMTEHKAVREAVGILISPTWAKCLFPVPTPSKASTRLWLETSPR